MTYRKRVQERQTRFWGVPLNFMYEIGDLLTTIYEPDQDTQVMRQALANLRGTLDLCYHKCHMKKGSKPHAYRERYYGFATLFVNDTIDRRVRESEVPHDYKG